MNDIDIRHDGIARMTLASAPGAQAEGMSQEWLRQWENARWQEQPRYRAATERIDAASEPNAAAERAPMQARMATIEPSGRDGAGLQSSIPSSAHAAGMGGAAFLAVARGDLQRTSTSAALPSSQQLAPVIDTKPAAVDTPEGVVSTPGVPVASIVASAAAQWSARSVHVHVGDDVASVWIRDAALNDAQAQDITERLRSTISADGRPLPIRLTVNGRPVRGRSSS